MIKVKPFKLVNSAHEDLLRKFSKRVVVVIPKTTSDSTKTKKVVEPGKILIQLSEEFLYGKKVQENKLVRSPRRDTVKITKKTKLK